MGNSLINDKQNSNSNNGNNTLIVKSENIPDRNKKIIEYNNKKYINNKEIHNISNNSINEKDINFLRIINKPIKKIKNKVQQNINNKIMQEDLELDNTNLKTNLINDELKKGEKIHNTKKVNQNLYEFEINNHKFVNYKDEKNKNNFYQKNEDNFTSERTINNTNSDGEFFFDDIHKIDEIEYNNNKNIFGNIIKCDFNRNNNNIKNKDNLKNPKQNKIQKNNEVKIKINDIKYKKIQPKSKQNNQRQDNNNIIKIHHTNNNNNVLLISSFLTNSNTLPRNKINKSETNYRTRNRLSQEEINNNFTFKNLSNNIICLKNAKINSYKEKETLQLKDNKNARYINTKKISSSNYSYNYNNFYICNNDFDGNNNKNNTLDERRKMTELISKIPNNKLKNQIMNLYEKIINYNNEIIINDKHEKYDYIITYSNNYVKINENKFIGKKFNENNFKKRNEIKIYLIPNKQKNFSSNSHKIKEKIHINNYLNNESNILKNNKIKNINNNSQKNIIINNPNNNNKKSVIKQFTYEQYKKYQSENTKLKNTKRSFELPESEFGPKVKIKKSVNYSFQKSEKIKHKIKINSINPKAWKKIINLNEVTINKEKIFPLTIIEKNNCSLIKEIVTNYNDFDNDKNICEEKDLRNLSMNNKTKKEKFNYNSKTSKSIDTIKVKDNSDDFNKYNNFYTYNLGKEKIILKKNLKKLLRVKNLLKDIKQYQKNFIFKEEDIVMINSICFVSKNYIIIFKDKIKKYPMFKKKLKKIKKIMSFQKNYKYILIIEFNNYKKNNEKDEYLGLLIDNEKNYNEFIGLFSQIIPNLEIEFLN